MATVDMELAFIYFRITQTVVCRMDDGEGGLQTYDPQRAVACTLTMISRLSITFLYLAEYPCMRYGSSSYLAGQGDLEVIHFAAHEK